MDLKQLSALLGISPTTISRALNGYPEVSEATRRRVEEAAEAHGYRPNHAARRLALGKADAVGIIYPPDIVELGDPGALGVVGALTEHFNAQGSDLVIVITGRKNELATYARLVQGRRVDALIVARTWVNDARVDYLLRRGFPFVAFGRTARCADHAWFDFDNTAGRRHGRGPAGRLWPPPHRLHPRAAGAQLCAAALRRLPPGPARGRPDRDGRLDRAVQLCPGPARRLPGHAATAGRSRSGPPPWWWTTAWPASARCAR